MAAITNTQPPIIFSLPIWSRDLMKKKFRNDRASEPKRWQLHVDLPLNGDCLAGRQDG
jgi:hypothetical protein